MVEPEGMPWQLDAGNDLILNMHLKPSGKPEPVAAEIGLYFTDAPPSKQPMLLQLEHDSALDIPAGKRDFMVEDEFKLPVAVDVLGIYPHAHYLGKDLQAYAVLPGGRKVWLIWIRDWDIDRQSVYRYRHGVYLPKGTTVYMCTIPTSRLSGCGRAIARWMRWAICGSRSCPWAFPQASRDCCWK